ncbi:AC4 [Whitefly-associated begomovirus 4]|uniref:AC4 n=1 Tax=Whitefly-associated begomovirus 4 TaxID=2169742 RepID=A0A0P0IFE3_9GEMI|nr:AC4 [Whitefly-associated begomovirus 4]ALK03460.1 AC4 [Whitefly-associated begomovirus 4]
MGSLISTCSFSSRVNTNARITDSSTWSPHLDQHHFIPTYRELNPAPTSSPTSPRTVTQSTGESFKSTADLLEEANNLLMTHMRRP